MHHDLLKICPFTFIFKITTDILKVNHDKRVADLDHKKPPPKLKSQNPNFLDSTPLNRSKIVDLVFSLTLSKNHLQIRLSHGYYRNLKAISKTLSLNQTIRYAPPPHNHHEKHSITKIRHHIPHFKGFLTFLSPHSNPHFY